MLNLSRFLYDTQGKNRILKIISPIAVIIISAVLVPPMSAHADTFTSRCTAAGVVLCSGFDSADDIDSFVSGNEVGTTLGVFDPTNQASGTGSMKFTIPSRTGANSSGDYERLINESSAGYKTGSVFFVQFRQRFSPEMLSSAMGGNGWKQVEITTPFSTYGDAPGIGLFNQSFGNMPVLYVNGATFTQTPSDGTAVSYVANQWMTFAFEIHVGDWGAFNTTVKVWAAPENQPLKQIYNVTNAAPGQNPSDPDSGYNKIMFGPNNTGKLATTVHTPATTWYDELVVSNNQIADPFTPADTTAPVLAEVTPVPTPTSDNTPDYTFSSTEAGTITYGGDCTSATTAAVVGNNTVTFNTLADGVHMNCTIMVTDAASNQSLPLSVNTFTVDTTVPDTTPPVISAVTSTAITQTGVTISWMTDENSTSQVDYGPTTSYGSSTALDTSLVTSHSQNITGLTAGTIYHFHVKSADAANNLATSDDFNFTTLAATDTTAPVLAEVTAVPSPTNDNTPDYTFSSTEAGTITYGGDCSSATTSAVAGNNTVTFNTLPDGVHSNCTIVVTDASGNASTALNVSAFTVNTATPAPSPLTVTINQSAKQADPTKKSPVSFTIIFSEKVKGFKASDVNFSGTATVGKPYLSGYSATFKIYVPVKTSGTVIATIPAGIATDKAGNSNAASTSTDNTITFDNTPPVISAVASSAITLDSATITWTTDENSDSQVDYGTTNYYGFSTKLDKTLVMSHSQNLTGLLALLDKNDRYHMRPQPIAGKTIHFRVRSKDALGNLAKSADFTFTTVQPANGAAPTVTINQAAGQADPTNQSPISFTIVFSEPVIGFSAKDVKISGVEEYGYASLSGTGPTYTLSVPVKDNGTVTASIPANVAIDSDGNGNVASTSTDNSVTFKRNKIYADGTVICGSGPTLYMVSNHGHDKLSIPSMAVFNRLKLSLKNVVRVDDRDLSDYHDGGQAH
ncbi:MAG: fibronectin type III domain-containing protein [Candidatus Doudnabacteria bacterium]